MSPRPEGSPGAPVGLAVEAEEIELKLTVHQQGVIRTLLRRPPAAGIAGFVPAGPVRIVGCVDRYFDTEGTTAWSAGALGRAGLRARLREQDGTVILALKSAISRDGAVSRRMELQGPATNRLDPEDWPPSDARSRLKAVLDGRPIVEIAALRQRRLQRDFGRAGTTVEISLDEMTALDGRRVLGRQVEVEAELLSGDVASLRDLAAALVKLPGIDIAAGSKLAFALAARTVAAR